MGKRWAGIFGQLGRRQPKGDDVVWRYMDLARFISLLQISANTRPGNHIETRSELFSCGQLVGKPLHPTITISNHHTAILVNSLL